MGCNYLSLPEIPASGNKVLKWLPIFSQSQSLTSKCHKLEIHCSFYSQLFEPSFSAKSCLTNWILYHTFDNAELFLYRLVKNGMHFYLGKVVLYHEWRVPLVRICYAWRLSYSIITLCIILLYLLLLINTHLKGILPKRPYLPCVSMAGRALLAGYHRSILWKYIILAAAVSYNPYLNLFLETQEYYEPLSEPSMS